MDLKKHTNDNSKVTLKKETEHKINLVKGEEEPKINLNKESSNEKVILQKDLSEEKVVLEKELKEKVVLQKEEAVKKEPKPAEKPKEEPKPESKPNSESTPFYLSSSSDTKRRFNFNWDLFWRIFLGISVVLGFVSSLAFTIVVFKNGQNMELLSSGITYGLAGAAGVFFTIVTFILIISYIVHLHSEGHDALDGCVIGLGVTGLIFSIISIPSAAAVGNQYSYFDPQHNVTFTLVDKDDLSYTQTKLTFKVENNTGVDLSFVQGTFTFFNRGVECRMKWELYSYNQIVNGDTNKMTFTLDYDNGSELSGYLSNITFKYYISELEFNYTRHSYDEDYKWGTVIY